MTLRLRLLIRFRPVLRFIKYRVLHTDDSPERIARGIAIGLFTAWLPFFGLHILLALLFAAIFRANKAMAVLFIWVSNPLTAPFIYYPCYRVGRLFLGFFREQPAVDSKHIEAIFAQTLNIRRFMTELFTTDLWKQIWEVISTIGMELLVGGLILGLIVAKLSYRLSLAAIKAYHSKHTGRKQQLKGKQI